MSVLKRQRASNNQTHLKMIIYFTHEITHKRTRETFCANEGVSYAGGIGYVSVMHIWRGGEMHTIERSLIERDYDIVQVGEYVDSESSNRSYFISYKNMKCSCPCFQYRKSCNHLAKLKSSLNF